MNSIDGDDDDDDDDDDVNDDDDNDHHDIHPKCWCRRSAGGIHVHRALCV